MPLRLVYAMDIAQYFVSLVSRSFVEDSIAPLLSKGAYFCDLLLSNSRILVFLSSGIHFMFTYSVSNIFVSSECITIAHVYIGEKLL
jgi:hypothetical protein